MRNDRVRTLADLAARQAAMAGKEDTRSVDRIRHGAAVGWVGEWHENPKPQWIVPMSGRWFVESMDGRRAEMGMGDISFGEDQRTKVVMVVGDISQGPWATNRLS
ncbi:MAG: hypothetical protein ACR2GP_00810 [Burkholderiaceae bacterium]